MTDSPDPEADTLAFTPVPSTSARHDGWTAERQRQFIDLLATHGGVAHAARTLGMTPRPPTGYAAAPVPSRLPGRGTSRWSRGVSAPMTRRCAAARTASAFP